MAASMRQRYVEAGDWWEAQRNAGLQVQETELPADLLECFQQMAET
jgi:hypothetical protein